MRGFLAHTMGMVLFCSREEERELREQAAREKRRNEEERTFLEKKLEEERRRRAKAESESAAEIARLQRELEALRPNKVRKAVECMRFRLSLVDLSYNLNHLISL